MNQNELEDIYNDVIDLCIAVDNLNDQLGGIVDKLESVICRLENNKDKEC